MATLDVFNTDAFNLRSMVAAVNKALFKPGRIGRLGLFQASGMTTTVAMVEIREGRLELITNSARGAPGTNLERAGRTAVPIAAAHLVKESRITADSVQNVRAFGSETEAELVQGVVDDELATLRAFHEVTLEWHRLGAIKGIVLDANGTTQLLNLFTVFGLSQQTQNLDLSDPTMDVADECVEIARMIEDKLGARPYTSIRAICGKTFLAALRDHVKVREAYNFQAAQLQALGGDIRDGFRFGPVTFEEYRGSVSSQQFVADAVGYAFPEGTDIFVTKFAPADYEETVNTMGLPIYAKQEPGKFNKWRDIETQSNPLNICTQPDAVIKLTSS